jgi:hypothetical protein
MLVTLLAVDNILGDWTWGLDAALAVVFLVSFAVGIIALALNIPLLLKTFRERRRLDELGLGTLYTSLWKENRRTRWISRLRSALLLGIGIVIVVGMVFVSKGLIEARSNDDRIVFAVLLLFWGVTAGLLFGARYLRNQREQMDLAASAEQLKADLQKRREQDGLDAAPGDVSVPAEILERTAIIESAQIRKERKDAVLQSATLRESTYAITFEPTAAEQRTALGRADRLELEDLVADLSAEGAKGETQATAVPGADATTFRRATENKHVEIDYVVDYLSRRIQVIAVRPGEGGSQPSTNGAGNG